LQEHLKLLEENHMVAQTNKTNAVKDSVGTTEHTDNTHTVAPDDGLGHYRHGHTNPTKEISPKTSRFLPTVLFSNSDQDEHSDILQKAMYGHRVLAVGQPAISTTNREVSLLEKSMPGLKREGATDLAVEVPTTYQRLIDKFMADPKAKTQGLAAEVGSNNADVIESAKSNHLKVVAVGTQPGEIASHVEALIAHQGTKVVLQDNSMQDSFRSAAVDLMRAKHVSILSAAIEPESIPEMKLVMQQPGIRSGVLEPLKDDLVMYEMNFPALKEQIPITQH
jgi:predicted double-glycine peptidase